MGSKRLLREGEGEDGRGGSALFHLLVGTSRWPRAWALLTEKITQSERAALFRASVRYDIACGLCYVAVGIPALFLLSHAVEGYALRMAASAFIPLAASAFIPLMLAVPALVYAVRARPRRLAQLLSQTHWATEHGVTRDALLAARTRKGSSGIDLESL